MPAKDRAVLTGALESFNRASGELPDDDWYLGWA
jgi:hypothetical protein